MTMQAYATYRIVVKTDDDDAIENGNDDLNNLCEAVEAQLKELEMPFNVLVHHCDTKCMITIEEVQE